MFIGFGTAVDVVGIVVGSGIGMALGERLPVRTRDTVTDALGLTTLMIGALSAKEVTAAALSDKVGSSAPVLIVLGALLFGGILGSLIDLERRLESLGDWLRVRLAGGSPADVTTMTVADPETGAARLSPRERFIQGFVSASLIFSIGPLTILGSLADGMGRGADQLILKAVLDLFSSIAFASSLGIGVMASAIMVGLVQAVLTILGAMFGAALPEAHLLALTATGGLMLIALSLRLLNIRAIPVGNLLPALVIAPLLVSLAQAVA